MKSTLGTLAIFLVWGLDHVNSEGAASDHAMDKMSTHSLTKPSNMGSEPESHVSHPPSYFSHIDSAGLMYGHITVMCFAWVIILPVAVMLSLARSRYSLYCQLAFLAFNTLGVLLVIRYNANVPDLFPGNAHHKLGWIVSAAVAFQVAIHLLKRAVGQPDIGRLDEEPEEMQSFIKSTANQRQDLMHRFSDDSGHGTESNTDFDTDSQEGSSIRLEYLRAAQDDGDDIDRLHRIEMSGNGRNNIQQYVATVPQRAWRCFNLYYQAVDRTILILGFVALCTGVATLFRLFEGSGIFSGLAHWIKGGVFFWLGIFTLGRWSGSFGEIGWAWNKTPRLSQQKWRPSAEFVESCLVFVYGSTNIFLEHLSNAGKAFSPKDLEHVSITVLFIGGGLCGMLIESAYLRELLNHTVTQEQVPARLPDEQGVDEETGRHPPDTYKISLNPVPAIVILLVGIMMGSHGQADMASAMIHKQWGDLLFTASCSRVLTYVVMYLKPPLSILPSRPPTELITSGGLMAGGIIFMASASDTVATLKNHDLDMMFMYTITMGLCGTLMAWVLLLLALKGWVQKRESSI